MYPITLFRFLLGALTVGATLLLPSARAVEIVLPAEASPRVHYAAERLRQAVRHDSQRTVILGRADSASIRQLIENGALALAGAPLPAEGFSAQTLPDGRLVVIGADDSGVLYGALAVASRVSAEGKLPRELALREAPALRLRGPAIGMQKTYILPGRKVYEYPYTPELFPFFYDKTFWADYLDYLVEHRMNTLYLWNGHPFASLVKLEDYPYALEVSEEVFARNVEMMRYITQEADKRGIWLVQMFYNILLSKPFAERHGLSTQLAQIEPVAADYTRKSIAEFVRQYPNVGLLVCLGEALQDVPQQSQWCTEVILAGVKDGMKRAGLTEEPPVVIRAHATDESVVMPAALKVYRNLYTMAKFNGESLTTWEPRGVWQERHLAMSRLGSTHVVNVHILANLEPFRYGAPRFIQKSVQASRDRLGAGGLHLYPLTYWNWPYSPDVTPEPLAQIDRDWIWFEAWARYAWNPDIGAADDRKYWVSRLTQKYGTEEAGRLILEAYNDSGECAPRILRRFGITEGNRQTLSLGMTLEQLVDPERARPYPELWLSQAPPGERLQEYVEREWRGQPHEGETPPQIIEEILRFSASAVAAIEAAAPQVTRNREEFERLRNDMQCIEAMSQHYAEKVRAAMAVLRHRLSGDPADLRSAEEHLARSVRHFRRLAELTERTYHFANSMQTNHRRVPVPGAVEGEPANYHWRDLVPVYERELADFRREIAAPGHQDAEETLRLTPVPFQVVSRSAEAYPVRLGERTFTDRQFTVRRVHPALAGLTGIRFADAAARANELAPVEIVVEEPVRVLIGYTQTESPGWRRAPDLDTDSHAAERGGTEPLLRGALEVDGVGAVDVYELPLRPGRRLIEPRGIGSYFIVGVVK